jgi:hypothetical protein
VGSPNSSWKVWRHTTRDTPESLFSTANMDTVLPVSRFELRLTRWAVGLALILMIPFFIAGVFQTRLGFVLLVGVPIYFTLAFVLGMIAMLISRLLSRFDHHFDPAIRRRILAVAGELPLPGTLQRPEAAITLPAAPLGALQALPKRSGPWPWVKN